MGLAADTHKSASLSDDLLYRYSLHRWWGMGNRLMFVMLNPSTADADVDDPTIVRCSNFARDMGFDGVSVFNLYALRATKPQALWSAPEPTGGQRNDDILREVGLHAKHTPVIVAWGNNAKPRRVSEVLAFPGWDNVMCLGKNKSGSPKHPLYLPASARPKAW